MSARQAGHPNLNRGLSDDPAPRARQLANLARGRNSAAKRTREALARGRVEELREAYPRAPHDLLVAQSRRLALCDLLAAEVAKHGVTLPTDAGPDTPAGTGSKAPTAAVSPVVGELNRALAAVERSFERLDRYLPDAKQRAQESLEAFNRELREEREEDLADEDDDDE